jgi:hypothetical protein
LRDHRRKMTKRDPLSIEKVRARAGLVWRLGPPVKGTEREMAGPPGW